MKWVSKAYERESKVIEELAEVSAIGGLEDRLSIAQEVGAYLLVFVCYVFWALQKLSSEEQALDLRSGRGA
jgi:hypothetical protein